MQPIIDTNDFFSLSSYLNYQLSGSPINWRAVLTLIRPQDLSSEDEELIIETIVYLGDAYGKEKRLLGPFAVLHPIRTAALLTRSGPTSTLELLTTLLHDKDEDITKTKFSDDEWLKLESRYQTIIRKVDSLANWLLNERIHFLTRKRNQSYHEYLISLINLSKVTPEIVRAKLADRLDNTLDLRMDLYQDIPGADPYQVIFKILFTDVIRGQDAKIPHHADRKINGARRLYQLFKNSVFLSLLRSEGVALGDAAQRLFDSLAISSINEALNTMLHVFDYHMRDAEKQKAVLMDVMDYCNRGGLRSINISGSHRLDGLFKKYFIYDDKKELKLRLQKLYGDKELMAEAAVAFAAIFTNFLNDPGYTIDGISGKGISPKKL